MDKSSAIQTALVICGLFICDFAYMQSRNDLFSGTYPLIYCHPWSFYMWIHYIRAYFWGPYLSHITRSTCILKYTYLTKGFNYGPRQAQRHIKMHVYKCHTNTLCYYNFHHPNSLAKYQSVSVIGISRQLRLKWFWKGVFWRCYLTFDAINIIEAKYLNNWLFITQRWTNQSITKNGVRTGEPSKERLRDLSKLNFLMMVWF